MEKLKPSLNKLLFFLLKPTMLALYFWVLIWFFTPNYFKKYSAEIVNAKFVNNNYIEYFTDLDNNGITEIVRSLYNRGGETPAISYFDVDDRIVDQWNLRGKWLTNHKLFFGDYNHNGYKEVYCLTRVGDSIFLNAKELLLKNGLEFEGRFICTTKMFKGDNVDLFVVDATTIDVNSDGMDEFVFSLFSGFSHQPRNTFSFDIEHDLFSRSPLSAAGFSKGIRYMDINNDGVDEITGTVSAVGNIHYEIPYTDSCSWLMVINAADSLDFLFPPTRFDGMFGGVESAFFTINGNSYVVSIFICKSAGNHTNGIILQIVDSLGNLINRKHFSYDEFGVLSLINPLNGDEKHIYLVNEHGMVFISDLFLNIKLFSIPSIENLVLERNITLQLDIDHDGENEILFIATRPSPDKLIIYRSNLKESTIVDLPESKLILDWHVTLKKDAGNAPLLVLQAENDIYSIKYGKSKYYLLKYPVYIIVFLLLYMLFWILQKGQNILAKRKFEAENKLLKLQMALSKRQLEPHFMLNTLNNIGHMFSKENKEDAQYYFGRFASLIHRGLKYADKTETSLFEELEFVRDYLILQQKRFDDDFQFSIESDEKVDLDRVILPHSLVYTFVENAVKHGLRHKAGRKTLKIKVFELDSKTIINICDNGIGRKKSKLIGTMGTGKGLEIISSIIDGYNSLNNRLIKYDVLDLSSGSTENTGTEVRVYIV